MGSFPRGRGCSSGPLRPEHLSCLCHRLSLFPQRPFWGTVVTVFKLKTGTNPSFRSKPPGRPRVPEKTWRCSLGSDGSRCAGWPVLCGARPPGARREAGGGAEGASAGSPRPAPAAARPAVLSAGPAGPVPHRPPPPASGCPAAGPSTPVFKQRSSSIRFEPEAGVPTGTPRGVILFP